MEQKFEINSIDIKALREFCEREGKMVEYRSGEQLVDFFRQDAEKMELRSVIAEHLLSQARACYIDLHRATARERYELLLQRCPGIVEHLALQDLASFLNVTPKTISMIRKDITFGKDLPHILQNNNDQFTCLLLCFVC